MPVQPNRWIGKPLKRFEDRRLLMGGGRFMDDLEPLPNIHHAAILRSPHAHALIKHIDVSAALAMPGVAGVLTGQDVVRMARPFAQAVTVPVEYYPLAVDRVRYVGEPVVVIVAHNRYLAEDALEHVRITYEPLPALIEPEEALKETDILLHEKVGSNIANNRKFVFGKPNEAFSQADLIVRARFSFPKYSSTPIETYGVIAEYDPIERGATIWSNFHGPFILHPILSQSLGIPENRLRLKMPADNGGSFGIKQGVFPYMALMTLASKKMRVPVKWIEDRREHLLSSSSGTDRISYAEAAVRADGTILALRLKFIDNVGAYIRTPEPACLYRTHANTTGPYRIDHLEVDNYAVMTNKSPTGLNRGYGGQQLTFVIERMMDLCADQLGIDKAAIRRRNFISKEEFPYRTPSGGLYDSGDYEAVLQKALDKADYDDLLHKQREARAKGKLFGIGIACTVEPSGSNMGYVSLAQTPEERAAGLPKSGCTDAVTIKFSPLGQLTVLLSSTPQGQGHETAAAQVVAEVLTVPPEQIRVVAKMDTDIQPWTVSSGSYSSRFAPLTTSALTAAAQRLKQKLLQIAAATFETAPEDLELMDGIIRVKGAPDRKLSLKRAAAAVHWHPAGLPPNIEPSLYETVHFTLPDAQPPNPHDEVDSSATYGFVAEAAAVEIDPATGQLFIHRYVSGHDAGRIINPLLADGQIAGSIAHGIGGALYEELQYSEQGQMLTASFMDYLCPTAMEVPSVDIVHIETASPLTPLGAKGLGEGSSMTAPVLLANAVADALGEHGHVITSLPLCPDQLWRLLLDLQRETA